ncbi:allose-6-phosphate isomerase/ribose-5-phosphate isomerase B [Trichlorobacter ammonificans]|uniref:Allose-6-phosphate isomerase/ribose-5-phosphate isomerase B n=2 Tax=Trichlorobacter ammonificans TaxID=2916410 RepID=A0ABM9D9H5_9BACT|nr:allose-6-phosphate isomerase/ribose-5-phosphate isomerase B [Trichlorobacter ammonificans]
MTMKIALGSDHGGVALKQVLIQFLQERDIEVADAGTNSDESVDYPDFGERVALLVVHGEADAGIVVCGTGIGISIAANKVPGIRAALVTSPEMARLAKEHNNANVLALGGRILDDATATACVAAWLDASFEGGRHQRRLDRITALEEKSCR